MKWWWDSRANCFVKLGKITTTTHHIVTTAFCSTWFTKQMTHYYFPQRNSLLTLFIMNMSHKENVSNKICVFLLVLLVLVSCSSIIKIFTYILFQCFCCFMFYINISSIWICMCVCVYTVIEIFFFSNG